MFKYEMKNGKTYFLNCKMVTLRNGRQQKLYYFSKDQRPETSCDLPEGKHVVETPQMPVLKNLK